MNKIRNVIIESENLGEALRLMRDYADGHSDLITGNLLSRLTDIVGDYGLMCDFMQRGYHDHQREQLYRRLLRKAYNLLSDWHLRTLTKKGNVSYQEAARSQGELLIPQEAIRQRLESYVQEQALQGLDFNSDDDEHASKNLFDDHQRLMNRLFCAILVSPQWHQADETFYSDLLLSPTIDILDARLLVSAVTLSAMTEFDSYKASLLATIYHQTSDETLRQRALVGFVFSMPANISDLFPEYKLLIDEMLADEQTRRELLELQLQVFYCTNADNDNLLIREDIMPNILKNQRFRLTRDGIEEIEDDPLEDILHPDAEDKAMEELEASIRRMMDLQQSGADIYFGGFSQMKRFSFFYTLSNWFTPFYVQHPALNKVVEKLRGSLFLQNLLESGPFCDSDKYSFALAMTSVLERLPESMRDMLNQQEAFGPMTDKSEQKSASYLRRMYLQDLYRFFRLYSQKNDFAFCNPFDYDTNSKRFFFANPLFESEQLAEQKLKLGKFLLSRKKHELLSLLFDSMSGSESPDFIMLKALSDMQLGAYEDARQRFQQVLLFSPSNERAMKGVAQSSFNVGDYSTAVKCYEQLRDEHPGNISYALNLSLAYINHGQASEAVRILYELHYENPESNNIRRVLAWGLLWVGNLEQAERFYQHLLALDKTDDTDFLNAGYCQWFLGHVPEATMLFSQFVGEKGAKAGKQLTAILADEFRSDAALLEEYKISDVDQKIMIDIVLEMATL